MSEALGRELAGELAEAIEITETTWLSFYFEAHRDLAADRGQSGHAPWQTLREYGLAHGFEGALLVDFIRLMRIMERAEIRGVKAREGAEQQIESGAEGEQQEGAP